MENRFSHLDSNNEKIKRIINSSFKIFSMNDFNKASTALVVKDAGISRGLLYHYFKDKQDLYEYLLYYSFTSIGKSMNERIDLDNNDFFDRLLISVKAKLSIINKYPFLFDFFDKNSHRISPEYFKKWENDVTPKSRMRYYKQNIDESIFKDDIDMDKMISVSRLTVSGILSKATSAHSKNGIPIDVESVTRDVQDHINFFKDQFYK